MQRCRCLKFIPFAIPSIVLLTSYSFWKDVPGVSGLYEVTETCDVTGSAGAALRALFVHANTMHWGGNVAATLMIGVPLETLHGSWRVACIYFGAGIVGVLCFAASSEVGTRYVGSSPAVYALIASFASHLMLNWSETRLRLYWLFVLIAYTSYDTFNAFEAMADPQNRVAHVSHLGGAIAGLFIALTLLRNEALIQWEVSLVLLGMVAYLTLLTTVLFESTCR